MVIAVLLPLIAALYVFSAAFLKKRTFAWEIGTAAVAAAFLNIVTMAFNNYFARTMYEATLSPFLTTIKGDAYDWRLKLDTTEIFLTVFVFFCALMSMLFVKDRLPQSKTNRFVVFLLGLVSCFVVAVGADNMFQFFAGWEMSAVFAYLSVMLFHEQQTVRLAGVNFLIWHALGDVALFCACFMVAGRTGGFYMTDFSAATVDAFAGTGSVVFAVLLAAGAGAKLLLTPANVMPQTAGIPVPVLSFVMPTAMGGLGVYALYEFFPFVENSPAARAVFAAWGTASAFAALSGALARTNIKAVLMKLLSAQFGFVLAVLGIVGRDAAFCAYIALVTPMTGLFLCAGALVRAQNGEEELTRMGGLRQKMPFVFWTMILLALCCVGFPHIGNSGVAAQTHAVMRGKGAAAGEAVLTLYSVLLAFVFARLIARVFARRTKTPANLAEIGQPLKTEALPMTVLLLLSFFQNQVFERSVLPDPAGAFGADVWLLTAAGVTGFFAGFLWFSNRECAAGNAVTRFLASDFRLPDLYRLIARSVLAAGDFCQRFAQAELLTEKLPRALRKTGEKLQKIHSGASSGFLTWTVAGLFALISGLFLALTVGG